MNAIKADALREAASDLYLTRPGQHNEHTAVWLRRRANLIDPRTRAEVCEHGYPLSDACGYCETSPVFSPGKSTPTSDAGEAS